MVDPFAATSGAVAVLLRSFELAGKTLRSAPESTRKALLLRPSQTENDPDTALIKGMPGASAARRVRFPEADSGDR